jgi:hypothetical protein
MDGSAVFAPWIRVLHGTPIVAQMVKKFINFYETRRFITVLTRAKFEALRF